MASTILVTVGNGCSRCLRNIGRPIPRRAQARAGLIVDAETARPRGERPHTRTLDPVPRPAPWPPRGRARLNETLTLHSRLVATAHGSSAVADGVPPARRCGVLGLASRPAALAWSSAPAGVLAAVAMRPSFRRTASSMPTTDLMLLHRSVRRSRRPRRRSRLSARRLGRSRTARREVDRPPSRSEARRASARAG
jgi:hypothetical protein